ncbi:MAG: toll/interleukin-1 receptor domain-containing protein [Anaerolineae bacterium]|nr:toll/interleukin-1 receptor domain-containing protein [Anaerolineae bacterium]
MLPPVFVSYSRKDMAFARPLVEALTLQGAQVWFDQNDIHGGENWRQSIEAGIKACGPLVFVMSPNALASEYCRKEVDFAQTLNKRIVPVCAAAFDSTSVWFEISALHYIDFVKKGFTTGFNELLAALGQPTQQTAATTRQCPACGAVGVGDVCPNGHTFLPALLGVLVGLPPPALAAYVSAYQARSGAEEVLAAALAHLTLRNYDAAAALLGRIVSANPVHAYAQYALALAGLRGNRPYLLHSTQAQAALTQAQSALAYDRTLAQAAYLLALIKDDYFRQNGYRIDPPDVATCLSMARQGRPAFGEIAALLALLPSFESQVMNAIHLAGNAR